MTSSPFTQLPDRVRYYLLDWKDQNIQLVTFKIGHSQCNTMSKDELILLFKLAYESDLKSIIL